MAGRVTPPRPPAFSYSYRHATADCEFHARRGRRRGRAVRLDARGRRRRNGRDGGSRLGRGTHVHVHRHCLGAVKAQIGAEVRVGSRISGRVSRLRANIGDRIELSIGSSRHVSSSKWPKS
jgi:hypothetical protein